MHYMSNGVSGQSAADAVGASNQFVQQQMADAALVLASGGNQQAMFLLGTAMHPLMDMLSPSHHAPNGLPLPWCGANPFSCSNVWDHVLLEDVDVLNMLPDVQQRENEIIRGWYQVLTGKPLQCNDCKAGGK